MVKKSKRNFKVFFTEPVILYYYDDIVWKTIYYLFYNFYVYIIIIYNYVPI